jgi:Leucine-rich repeat (LRR) protein
MLYSLAANNWENILVSISSNNFIQLTNLDISGNNISSISTLPQLDANHLTWLNISWNNISNLRNFKKCHFPKL